MSNLQTVQVLAPKIEAVLLHGDLSKLNTEEKISYTNRVCESLGLNPLTKPFDFIKFQGREILYATRSATDQLRKIHGVSVRIVSREKVDDMYVVTAQTSTLDGRVDEATGALSIKGLAGDALANAIMKCETKAKRRATLSICGLGMLDESERDTLPTESRAVEQVKQSLIETPAAPRSVPLPPADDTTQSGPPEHCGQPMMISKFQKDTYYCRQCRISLPFAEVQS